MAERRTTTIELRPENILSAHVEADLVDRFVRSATDENGSWRSKHKHESFEQALESAVRVALTMFIERE